MKTPLLFVFIVLAASFSALGQDSYHKEIILSARLRESTRAERERAAARMTFEERIQQSNGYDIYPGELATWGKGFSEGLAKVTVKGKAGFIDRSGKVIIRPVFSDAGFFSEGMAPFETRTGLWGYINRNGSVVIEPSFNWAFSFKEGIALVQVGEKWGYIDRSGKLLIPARFDEASGFREGIALVKLFLLGDLPGRSEPVNRYKTGFIDHEGNWVIEPVWDGGDDFDGGMARVDRNIGYNKGVISESLFIDRNGKELWNLNSWFLTAFEDDVLVVAVKRNSPNRDQYSFLDRSGKRLTDKTFDGVTGFSEGLSSVRIDGKMGFINKQGELVIPPIFESAGSFSEGLATAQLQFGRTGYIDKTGKFVIQPQFEFASEFIDGFALVGQGNKTGYIDKRGRYIWKPSE